jgi:hypothetical protein
MKSSDLVIAILIAVIFVIGILYQYGDNTGLDVKNCVKTTVTDQQLAECIRTIKQ